MTHPCQPMVALIPARAGSKRVPGKNTRLLNGHPLVAYSIRAALESKVFGVTVYCCTDDAETAELAWRYGAGLIHRPEAADDEPDIVWVRRAINFMLPQSFAILRPTSPFRTAETIRRAYRQFTLPDQTADSIRAVEPAKQSPYKMWTQSGPAQPIKPLLDGAHPDGTAFHSSPTQSLPTVYVQNSSLEMSWTANVEVHGNITGRKIAPFFTRDYEGFSIDTEADWREAEYLARTYPDRLPPVDMARLPPVPAA